MVLQQWSSFVNFLSYLVVSIPLLLIGIKIFMMQTPYNEMKIIQMRPAATRRQKMRPASLSRTIWAEKSSARRW